jgi:hypothetical protein
MADSDLLDDDTLQIAGVEEAEEAEETPESVVSPEEFFAKHAFRVIYQTNNFFLPQVKDLVTKGDILNIRPEYQRRLRWKSKQATFGSYWTSAVS